MRELAKKWIPDLVAYEPGKPLEDVARELGLELDDIFKMASNENALGPSPLAIEAMRHSAAAMHIYPDGGAFALRRALADKLDVDADQIVLGNGSNELIVFLSHIFLEPGLNIVMSDKAFVIYKLAAALYQADSIVVPMKNGYTHDLEAMLAAITPATRLVYVGNPNNPTGTMVDPAEIENFMARVPDHVIVVFDEAYIELIEPEERPDTVRYPREGRNVLVLRSFSKGYGLAGLRVGYAVAPNDGTALINHVRQPFNVNAMAQAAAVAALADEEHLRSTRRMVRAGLKQISDGLNEIGIDFVDSKVNFLLIRTGRGREVFQALQRKGVIVRPMDGYGMPEMIRVTVGTAEQNERFIRSLRHVLDERR